MDNKPTPKIVVGRLPLYLRALRRAEVEGRQVISSQDLGVRLGISAAQIRKDLSQFGEFGKQGTGYNVAFLARELSEILHIGQVWPVIIAGAGDVGHALARYQGFEQRGFRVVGIYDNNPSVIGTKIGSFRVISVMDMMIFIKQEKIKIAMVAVPTSVAQQVADKLILNGIRAILNYAPIKINAPSNIHIQYIDPVIHLQTMTYFL